MKKDKYSRRVTRFRTFEIVVTVIALLLLACAYAGKVDPSDFFPAPFLGLAFMPMLILAIVLLVITLVARRSIAFVILFVAMVICLPITHKFFPINTSENTPAMPVDKSSMLKVMTYNVLGFNYHEPSSSVQPSPSMQLILDADPDVVLMQEGSASGLEWSEIPSLKEYRQQITDKFPYTFQGNEGLCILSKFPFTTVPLGTASQGRSPLGFNRNQTSYIARAFDLQLPKGKQLRIIDFRLQSYHLSFGKNMSVRVSPDVKPSKVERMRRSFSLRGENAAMLRDEIDKSPQNVIVCGDMNDISASHVYRIICGDDLRDAWADVGLGYGYTYNRFGLRFRIDHILYRGALRALHIQRIKGGSSDHYPLMATFDVEVNEVITADMNLSDKVTNYK